MKNIQMISLAETYKKVGFNAFIQSSEPFEETTFHNDFSAKAHKCSDTIGEIENFDPTTFSEVAYYKKRLMSLIYYKPHGTQSDNHDEYLKARAQARAEDAINRREDDEIFKLLFNQSTVISSDNNSFTIEHFERLENDLWQRSHSAGCLFMRLEQLKQCEHFPGFSKRIYPKPEGSDYYLNQVPIFTSQYVPKGCVIMTVSPHCLGFLAPQSEVSNNWIFDAIHLKHHLTASRPLELVYRNGPLAASIILDKG